MQGSIAVTTVGRPAVNADTPIGPKSITAYWLATMYVGLMAAAAGISAIVRAPVVTDDVLRLGYPPHFVSLLGVWEMLGAVALCMPGRPLVKEWAYAGMFFNFSGAIVAHASVGDGAGSYIGPVVAMAALIVSWRLRPQSRRLVGVRFGR